MSTNKIYIAAAGSGKTKFIIDDVMNNQHNKVLITTFTNANEQSIRERLVAANGGSIPSGVIIQPWFSFLLEHGVRPYRFWDKKDTGICLVNRVSKRGVNSKNADGTPNMWYYFYSDMSIPTDKLSALVCCCNDVSQGFVVKRLERIFHHIYIDEVQDVAGWDFEIIKLLMGSNINVTMLGDQRQSLYSTNPATKYGKYSNGKIADFVKCECKKISCTIDDTTLQTSYRNSIKICTLSSKLYPNLTACKSGLKCTSSHMGIYFVRKKDVWEYASFIEKVSYEFCVERKNNVAKFMQLRRNKSEKRTVSQCSVLNFGISKGLEFYHVLIYPTKPILNWLRDNNSELKDGSRADFYVALTRAFFSVGIVVDDKFSEDIDGITIWNSNAA